MVAGVEGTFPTAREVYPLLLDPDNDRIAVGSLSGDPTQDTGKGNHFVKWAQLMGRELHTFPVGASRKLTVYDNGVAVVRFEDASSYFSKLVDVNGTSDTIVLYVHQHALVEKTTKTRRLEVGVPGAGPGYPVASGCVIDENGNLRTTGFLLTRHKTRGVVLRSDNDHFWAVTITDGGALQQTDLGTVEP